MFRSKFWIEFDYISLVLVLGLCAFGIISLAGATLESTNSDQWIKQLTWVLIGLGCCLVVLFFDYRHIIRYAPLFYVAGLIGLSLCFVPYIGHESHGARSWLRIYGTSQSIQPSEFAKITTILMLAKVLTGRSEQWNGLWDIFRPLLIGLLPALLILGQPDFGSAVIFGPITLLMMFVAGMPISFFLMLFLPFLGLFGISHDPVFILLWFSSIGGILIYVILQRTPWTVWLPFLLLSVLSYYVVFSQGPAIWNKVPPSPKARIMTYLYPDSVSKAQSWNIDQSKITLGSGGFWGVGFGQGTQSRYGFLPEFIHDFVFPAVGEQWGFVGGVVLIGLYMLLVLRGLETAVATKALQGALIASGVVALFFSHITINIGMVTGLLPVTGLPLTFISYGGSFMIASMVAVGLVMNIRMKTATEMIDETIMDSRSQMVLPKHIGDNDIWE